MPILREKRDRTKLFYEKYGFKPSPVNELTLMVTLTEVEAYIA